jgi:hypothetical protein
MLDCLLIKEKNNNKNSSQLVSVNLPVEDNTCPTVASADAPRKHRYRFTLEEIENFSVSYDSQQPLSIDIRDIEEPVQRHRYRFTLSEIEAFAPEWDII